MKLKKTKAILLWSFVLLVSRFAPIISHIDSYVLKLYKQYNQLREGC